MSSGPGIAALIAAGRYSIFHRGEEAGEELWSIEPAPDGGAVAAAGVALAGAFTVTKVVDFLKDSAAAAIEDEKSMVALAKAYEEMGDKDGARELLNEVVKEGDAAQKSQAEQMLAGLS